MSYPQPKPGFVWGVRLVTGLFFAACLVRVLSSAVSPDGFLSVTTDLSVPTAYVSEPKPSIRLDLEGGQPYRVLDGPIYLDLKPPSSFETVTVRAEYINGSQPLVEIGALANRLDGQYDLRTVESRTIDLLNWSRLSSGRLTLLQRNRRYSSIDDFLADPPPSNRVLSHRSNVGWVYRPNEGEFLEEPKVRQVSLRGHHRLLTYTSGEPLSFSFVVQDMNRQAGADPATVSVYREGEERAITRTVLADDGNTAADQKSSRLRTVSVSLPEPESGLYRIEFTASDDLFIRELSTRQSKFVFLDRLYLGDRVGYSDNLESVSVLVGSGSLAVRTSHVEGLQTLRVNGRPLEVQEPNIRQYLILPVSQQPSTVMSPRQDVLLETAGVFALSADDYFQPLPWRLDWHLSAGDLDSAGIDYVLTEYEPPERDGQLTVATATFDLSQLDLTDDGAYRFALSVPGLSYSDEDLRLQSVSFVLHRPAEGWLDGLARFWRESLTGETYTGQAVILPRGTSFGEEIN